MVSYDLRDLGISSVIGITGIVMLAVSVLVGIQIKSYLTENYYKRAQYFLIGVLAAPVVMGWLSYVSIFVGPSVPIDTLLLIYRLVYSYCFLEYLISILGWKHEDSPPFTISKESMFERLKNHQFIKCLCKCCGKIPVRTDEECEKFLKRLRLVTVQTFVVFPITFLTTIILALATDLAEPGDYSFDQALFYLDFIRNISFVVMTIHFMMLFRNIIAMKDFARLKMARKIVTAVVIALVTMPEPLIIGVFADYGLIADNSIYKADDITVFTYSLLLIIEMLVLGFLQIAVFPITHLRRSPFHELYDPFGINKTVG